MIGVRKQNAERVFTNIRVESGNVVEVEPRRRTIAEVIAEGARPASEFFDELRHRIDKHFEKSA